MENNEIWVELEEIEDAVFQSVWERIMNDYDSEDWLDAMDYYDADSPTEFVMEHGLYWQRDEYKNLKENLSVR